MYLFIQIGNIDPEIRTISTSGNQSYKRYKTRNWEKSEIKRKVITNFFRIISVDEHPRSYNGFFDFEKIINGNLPPESFRDKNLVSLRERFK